MKFIDNIRGVFHHYSTIALTAASGLQGAWLSIPDSIKAPLPGWVAQAVAWITLTVVLAGLGGKFIDQSPKAQDDPKSPL